MLPHSADTLNYSSGWQRLKKMALKRVEMWPCGLVWSHIVYPAVPENHPFVPSINGTNPQGLPLSGRVTPPPGIWRPHRGRRGVGRCRRPSWPSGRGSDASLKPSGRGACNFRPADKKKTKDKRIYKHLKKKLLGKLKNHCAPSVPLHSPQLWRRQSSRWSTSAPSLSGPPGTDGSSTPHKSNKSRRGPDWRRRWKNSQNEKTIKIKMLLYIHIYIFLYFYWFLV